MQEIRKSFWDFIAIASASLISIPLIIASESIQARYLGPANYGQVALILSAISLLYLFGLSWTYHAILRFGKEEFIQFNHLRITTSNLLILILGSVFITASIFFVFKNPILHFMEIKNLSFSWLIALGFLLATGKAITLEILKVIRLIKIQSFLYRLAGKIFILTGILLLIFIFKKLNVIYLIITYLISDLLIIIIGLSFIKLEYLYPLQFDKKKFKKIFLYCFPLLFSSWSTYVVDWIDVYIIKYYMTLQDVGVYQAAYKILRMLKSFWGMGLITILTPIIMVLKTKGEINKIREIYLERLVPQLSFLTMLIISFIILTSNITLYWIYGDKFSQTILPFKILIASHNFSVITFSLLPIITSFDMTKIMFYLGLSAGIINIVLDIILVPIFGINGAAISSLIVFSINPIIWFFYILRRFEVKRYLTLSFPVFLLLIMGFNILISNYYLRAFVTILLLILAYIYSRKCQLFRSSDVSILNNINIPYPIKKFLSKIILKLSVD